ncbi:sodium- potassium/hydrogen antiporter subunit D [Thermodesulfovibrio sp. N1]|uniref:monovalent cation/H+ antiporter subunit D family protein n=1 Tax=Thermodesulfovibrio sp. N1 TaxID=1871110 RepID=UPI00083B1991|nr:monovalent cation/H+ antiporter subunit D family protein [Thermodesulfovibrio sp. N1]ODA44633.1 sodium- potassium/hydrogen antiporter subunit D [Thermodesulfovibrio sp. N1]
MEIITSAKPLFAILVSLIATILIIITGEKARNLREAWTIIASIVKFTIVASMLPDILNGRVIEYTLLAITSELVLQFKVDAIGIFFAFTASFLWIITSLYSIGYMRGLNEHAQTRYFAYFAIAMSATMGVAFSANIFTAFLFYEIITVSTFPLVAHKETPEAIKGARKYLVYLLGTSVAFQLTAIIITYNVAGNLNFLTNGVFHDNISHNLITLTFLLYIAGITKAAIMPLHSWLPAAMVAPTPVSALLHAVAVVKTGVFMIVRVVLYIFGIDILKSLDLGTVLAYIASFTIIAASVIALRQDNLKLRLAYSTVSQLSYVVLGVALLSPSGVMGSIMHIVAHAFGKITLFFTAGAIYVATHKTNISQLDGIGRQMPFTMGAFTVGALSMIGIPPFAGFLSKWYLTFGALESDQLIVLAVLAVSTILNACYFMPIVYAAFFKEPKIDKHNLHETLDKRTLKEAPAIMVIALVLTAIGTILIFFFPSLFLQLAQIVVTNTTGGY